LSKKSRRKKNKQEPRRLTWPWLAAGGAVLLAVVLLLWQPWSGDNDEEPLTSYPESGSPRLVVEPRTVDAGYVKYEAPVNTTFVLRNEGDLPLKILEQPKVELVRGC
jgi:hypothetical protein